MRSIIVYTVLLAVAPLSIMALPLTGCPTNASPPMALDPLIPANTVNALIAANTGAGHLSKRSYRSASGAGSPGPKVVQRRLTFSIRTHPDPLMQHAADIALQYSRIIDPDQAADRDANTAYLNRLVRGNPIRTLQNLAPEFKELHGTIQFHGPLLDALAKDGLHVGKV